MIIDPFLNNPKKLDYQLFNSINKPKTKKMNLKLQEKDLSALFLALDEIVNFDLYKDNLFNQNERESILDIYKQVKKYNPYHLKENPRYVGRK